MANLDTLLPSVKAKALTFLDKCKAQGYDVRITSTKRTFPEQAGLFAIGRTVKGNPCNCGKKSNPVGTCAKHPLGLKVTNAGPGDSWHNWARAFDIAIFRNGKPVWGTGGNGIDNSPLDDNTDDLELWQRVGAIGKSVGLEWAGDWKSFPEFPHFQLLEGNTLAALKAKYPKGV